ncbi:hypothetical protein [Labilithrix luteola]|uniref:hypothetical protein n=1 Tax=Labilithrix luteola TaxID=1391654 RepID=UPI001F0A3C2F|nr:hypothetical protein [Labilithrix luteola]
MVAAEQPSKRTLRRDPYEGGDLVMAAIGEKMFDNEAAVRRIRRPNDAVSENALLVACGEPHGRKPEISAPFT